MNFSGLDYAVFILYAVVILFIGLYVSRNKDGVKKNAEDYFLASKSLPWWAIGASLIAANISAEQFIGMSGSGFAIGLAIATYEWMAAITLLIVGKYFLPIFIEKGLYTIPEFVEKRYSAQLKTILAIFWIALFVFVNLTTVLYLGGKAIDTIVGTGDGSLLLISCIGLAAFAAAYSLWGGLSAVAWTDVVQVVLLVIGGLITVIIALDGLTPDGGVFAGLSHLYDVIPEKFSMILQKGEIITPNGKDAWWDLPGVWVLIGGMWVANIYYWGFNQYIIQRTLAAKSLKESQKGIAFAAFLKLIIPIIVVLPGMIAYVYNMDLSLGKVTLESVAPTFLNENSTGFVNDNAAPWLISEYVPMGLKGLVLAALAAAIVSSLASMVNSVSTIFTMDIYQPLINQRSSQTRLVNVGRITGFIALVIAIFLAPMLKSLGQVFQYIQEYTGVVSPGILAVFVMGLFYKKASNKGAIFGVLASIPIALLLKLGPDAGILPKTPFLHQMGITALLTMLIILIVSGFDNKGKNDEKAIEFKKDLFHTSGVFNISAMAILLIVAFLYAYFW